MLIKDGTFKVIKCINHIELGKISEYLTNLDIVYFTSSSDYYDMTNPFLILTKEEFDKIPMLDFNYKFKLEIACLNS